LRINYKPPATAGVCHICDNVFSDDLLISKNDFYLCSRDVLVYDNSQWVLFFQTESSPTDPEQALFVQDLKDKLKTASIASYILTEYKQVSNEVISIFTILVGTADLSNAQIILQKNQ
jgi:hypothetical protein